MAQIKDGTTENSELRLSVFASLWAVATLFHQAKAWLWVQEPWRTLLTLSAIITLLRPNSKKIFFGFVAVQTGVILHDLPFRVTNHWMFTLFADLTILTTLLHLVIRRGTSSLTAANIMRGFAPALRFQLILMYFFTVLHKLNTSFFDIQSSCAVVFYSNLTNILPGLPQADWAKWTAIVFTILIEAFIPIGLTFRSTRYAALATGLIFHTIVGINDFFDFSAMVYAIFFLFVPHSALSTLPHVHVSNKLRLSFFVVLAFTVLLGAIKDVSLGKVPIYAGTTYSLLLFCIFVAAVPRKKIALDAAGRLFFPWYPLHYLLIALFLLNGSCPYLGLKTEASFAMFSNLRTEGNVTNHLFLPVDTQLFDFQKDIVLILRSSDPDLNSLAIKGIPITFHTFIVYLQSNVKKGRHFTVSYSRNGVVQNLRTSKGSWKRKHKISYLSRKLMQFREVQLTERTECAH